MDDFKKNDNFGGNNSSNTDESSKSGGNGRNQGDRSLRDGYGSQNGGSGDRLRFNRSSNKSSKQTQMFNATCAKCHKPCEVPFRPSGDRPVYCNYCFGKNKIGSSSDFLKRNGSNRRDNSGNNAPTRDLSSPLVSVQAMSNSQLSEMKRQLDALNAKVDKLIEMITKGHASIGHMNVETRTKKMIVKPKKTKKKSAKK